MWRSIGIAVAVAALASPAAAQHSNTPRGPGAPAAAPAYAAPSGPSETSARVWSVLGPDASAGRTICLTGYPSAEPSLVVGASPDGKVGLTVAVPAGALPAGPARGSVQVDGGAAIPIDFLVSESAATTFSDDETMWRQALTSRTMRVRIGAWDHTYATDGFEGGLRQLADCAISNFGEGIVADASGAGPSASGGPDTYQPNTQAYAQGPSTSYGKPAPYNSDGVAEARAADRARNDERRQAFAGFLYNLGSALRAASPSANQGYRPYAPSPLLPPPGSSRCSTFGSSTSCTGPNGQTTTGYNSGFGSTTIVGPNGQMSNAYTDRNGNTTYVAPDGQISRAQRDRRGNTTITAPDGRTTRTQTDGRGNTTIIEPDGRLRSCHTDSYGNTVCI